MRATLGTFLHLLVARVMASPKHNRESQFASVATPSISAGSYIASPSSFQTTETGYSRTSDSGVSVPADCFKPHGVPVGWLPDGVNITTIQNKVNPGTRACTYGDYAHIVSFSDYGYTAMDASASAAAQSGAVLTISLQPYIPFNQVNISKIVSAMENILRAGNNVVWLRFAHEMNWYISTNSKNKDTPYIGSTSDFKILWETIATSVDRSKVKMFWSPNSPVPPDTITSIGTDWWPGAEYVDIVGLDVYCQSESKSFADAFGEFYDIYAKPYNLPFALGETGWFNGGTDAQKQYWLGQVSSKAALDRCPNYLGFSWFEYDKPPEGDFRVVMGSSDLASTVLG